MELNASYTSLVAVGDSFTEGMSDLLPDGTYRGWADVLASRLASRSPGFRYANLAVRGKLISQIVDEQVGAAAAMQADVVTLVGGLNDTLRPKCDMAMVRGRLEEAVERLAPSCKQLVLMRSPGRNGPVFDRFRPRMEALFALIDDLAGRHGAVVVDLYSAPSLSDPRMWDADRLHLAAEGHRRVAEAVWQTLGLPPELDWQAPVPASLPPHWANRRADDIRFARRHLGPWIGRRLTGRSSGDGRWGAQFDPGTTSGFWITPADAEAPGPVTGWRRASPEEGPSPASS
ncbi:MULTISPECIES: SGNH/GDSL hydrolase family protein [Streptomyces]|uniref:SGNH/GDSL hydrolase family protein n=1 Tax=Streptomyces cyaneofuscatus TaxID=66883 RepID=A0ABZ1EQH9_9ACTN|nr:SGNH/GDSL hydrolase family protein [Streptomyces cyaneofuscatus]WSB06371.1 SGNH/GDSL hydrolase family protein [Streptomyces cyaneofuscatus]WSD50094.1 SGNH/GDSL hydrolase family protein [Streptomyces cyaneofuscatus]WTA93513.1 SGNH/GDSL hydrolase family protein [Streptomyces cyaneofuscatus]